MTGLDLQTALNTASSGGGGCVQLPAGAIDIRPGFSLPPNIWLRGEGAATVLRPHPDYSAPALLDTGQQRAGVVRLSDLTVDGCGRDLIGIFLQGVDAGSGITNVAIRNTIRSGVIIGSVVQRAHGVRVSDCHFQNCGQLSSTGDFMGIGVVNAIDVQLQGNQIIDSPIAIDCEMHPNVDDALMNVQISGNLIRTSQAYLPTCWGVSVLGQPGRSAKWVSITGNHCFGPSSTPPWLYTEHVEHFAESGNHVWP